MVVVKLPQNTRVFTEVILLTALRRGAAGGGGAKGMCQPILSQKKGAAQSSARIVTLRVTKSTAVIVVEIEVETGS